MTINPTLFSSASEEWETPQDLFDKLNEEFHFVIDLAASEENHKCDRYLTKIDNALTVDWWLTGGWKWLNPPYGRGVGEWVQKAYRSGRVVMLLPARTDTKWFHQWIYNKEGVEIRFLRGRLKFGGSKNSAPFPSMIVVFK